MYIYRLSHGDYEDFGYLMLSHEKWFSIEEWDSMVFDCALEAAKMRIEKEREEYINTNQPNYIKYAADYTEKGDLGTAEHYIWCSENMRLHVSFEELQDAVYHGLQNKFGFQELQYAHTTGFHRDSTLLDPPHPEFPPIYRGVEDHLGDILRKTVHTNPLEPHDLKERKDAEELIRMKEESEKWDREGFNLLLIPDLEDEE